MRFASTRRTQKPRNRHCHRQSSQDDRMTSLTTISGFSIRRLSLKITRETSPAALTDTEQLQSTLRFLQPLQHQTRPPAATPPKK
jgi:hypothetical protein